VEGLAATLHDGFLDPKSRSGASSVSTKSEGGEKGSPFFVFYFHKFYGTVNVESPKKGEIILDVFQKSRFDQFLE